jgi:hypothetical protein
MKVQIVNGTYGYHPAGAAKVRPVSAGDAPIEVPDDEARRLVELGVAKAVGTAAASVAADTGPVQGNTKGKVGTKAVDDDRQNADNDGSEMPDLGAAEPAS